MVDDGRRENESVNASPVRSERNCKRVREDESDVIDLVSSSQSTNGDLLRRRADSSQEGRVEREETCRRRSDVDDSSFKVDSNIV